MLSYDLSILLFLSYFCRFLGRSQRWPLFINGCFNWMIPNLYIGNGCFTKHPFFNGCLGFQVSKKVHTWYC